MSKWGVVTPKAALSVPPRRGFGSGARIRGEAPGCAVAGRGLPSRELAAPSPLSLRKSRRLVEIQAPMEASLPFGRMARPPMRLASGVTIADASEDVKAATALAGASSTPRRPPEAY